MECAGICHLCAGAGLICVSVRFLVYLLPKWALPRLTFKGSCLRKKPRRGGRGTKESVMALSQVKSYSHLTVVSVLPEMPFDLLISSDSELFWPPFLSWLVRFPVTMIQWHWYFFLFINFRGRERKRYKHRFLFYLFMPSLVNSFMYPDQALTCSLGVSGWCTHWANQAGSWHESFLSTRIKKLHIQVM